MPDINLMEYCTEICAAQLYDWNNRSSEIHETQFCGCLILYTVVEQSSMNSKKVLMSFFFDESSWII